MAGALGADIHGVDLSQPLDEATFAEIERAFHQYLVLFFHDQRLTPEQRLRKLQSALRGILALRETRELDS